MKFKIFLLILMFVFVSSQVFCADKVVTVATLEDFAPFCKKIEGRDSDGSFPPGSDSTGLEGYSWDVLRESFHEMGFIINLFVTPWVRALKSVQNGEVDILFPAGKNTNRQKTLNYSELPVNHTNFLIYVRRDDPIEWNGLKSLDGSVIGMKRGFNYGDKWKAATNIKKQNIGTIIQGFRMLDYGRIDGFVGYETNWDYVLKQTGWEGKYRKLPVFDSTFEYLVALKTNPRSIEILKAFDRGKQILLQNGKMRMIEKKWFGKE